MHGLSEGFDPVKYQPLFSGKPDGLGSAVMGMIGLLPALIVIFFIVLVWKGGEKNE